ncbi:hypothetical protein LSUE1_G004120 [Lachnellula suecica]|uniref:Gfd2/YDR514C-like C-terminal domain-containing protein n=1 Tax=Lachnellula suecica TaxID=602035 RepID=A0A8T9C2S9_9HELO|nr:hypothetical protein LSUE1_G004120 [Lachnellula suecica]
MRRPIGRYKNPVFFCIDTEGDRAREIGISVLDTRDLKSHLASDIHDKSHISSFNYQLRRHEKAEFKSPFQFGTSRMLEAPFVSSLSKKSSVPVIQVPLTKGVEIPSCHEGDISVQKFLYVLVFDTQYLRQPILGGPAGDKKLIKLLKKLRVPYGLLHNAGNDSNFTLKALLALALRGCPPENETPADIVPRRRVIPALEAMPMPLNVIDHLEPVSFEDCYTRPQHYKPKKETDVLESCSSWTEPLVRV